MLKFYNRFVFQSQSGDTPTPTPTPIPLHTADEKITGEIIETVTLTQEGA